MKNKVRLRVRIKEKRKDGQRKGGRKGEEEVLDRKGDTFGRFHLRGIARERSAYRREVIHAIKKGVLIEKKINKEGLMEEGKNTRRETRE